MKINYKSVGTRIKRLRLQGKMTQEELAFQIDTSAAYICCIETGKKKPSLQKLVQIADTLGVTLNDIVYDSTISTIGDDELDNHENLSALEKRALLKNITKLINQIDTF